MYANKMHWKKLDKNYKNATSNLNKYLKQRPTKQQLYSYLPSISKNIQIRRRHGELCWRNKEEVISEVLPWIPTHGRTRVGRPTRRYLHQLSKKIDWNVWRERRMIGTDRKGFKEIYAFSETRWYINRILALNNLQGLICHCFFPLPKKCEQ